MVGDTRWTKTQVKKLSKSAGEFQEIAEMIRKESKTKALYEIQEYVEKAYPLLAKSWDILKDLILESGRPNASLVVDQIVKDVAPVEIGFNEKGWFRLKMSSLPPKELASNVNYIRDVLYVK